jgi:hypothetical protein
MIRAFLAGSILLIGGCARDPGTPRPSAVDSAGVRIVTSVAPRWTTGQEWRLDERAVLVIGADGDSLHQLTGVSGVVRLSDGRLVVAMDQPKVVRVYDSTGKFLHNIGRHGQGPGEYESPERLVPVRGGSIIVAGDRGSMLFSVAGAFGREVRLEPAPRQDLDGPSSLPLPRYAFGDGTLVEIVKVFSKRSVRASIPAGTVVSDSNEV